MKIPVVSKWVLRWILAGGLLLPALAFAGQVPAWLLLSPDSEDSLMTVAVAEKEILVKAGWRVEGAGEVQAQAEPGTALLHRLIRKGAEGFTRMLESDSAQLARWQKAGYVEEGLLGHVAAVAGEGRIAVVQFTKGEQRLWLVEQKSGEAAEKRGWKRQGVQFWLWPASAP